MLNIIEVLAQNFNTPKTRDGEDLPGETTQETRRDMKITLGNDQALIHDKFSPEQVGAFLEREGLFGDNNYTNKIFDLFVQKRKSSLLKNNRDNSDFWKYSEQESKLRSQTILYSDEGTASYEGFCKLYEDFYQFLEENC